LALMNSARPAMTSGRVFGHRRDRRADTGLHVRPQCVPGADAAHLELVASGVRGRPQLVEGRGGCGPPSASTISPAPPPTSRIVFSKSSCSSRFADQSRIPHVGVRRDRVEVGVLRKVRRGPVGKIQATLSLSPEGWHAEQALQPFADRRPTIGCPPGAAGSKTPTEEFVELLADLHHVLRRSRSRQALRGQRRQHLLARRCEVDRGHVARDVVS
jgi:hypothetical protein